MHDSSMMHVTLDGCWQQYHHGYCSEQCSGMTCKQVANRAAEIKQGVGMVLKYQKNLVKPPNLIAAKLDAMQ
jgi:hypothetical protein